jgi:hypothetical protein
MKISYSDLLGNNDLVPSLPKCGSPHPEGGRVPRLKKFWSRSAMGERTMIIEPPILVMLGVLAIGATVWWVYS